MLSDVTLSWHAEALAEVATIQQFSAPLGLFPYMQFGKKNSAPELPQFSSALPIRPWSNRKSRFVSAILTDERRKVIWKIHAKKRL